MSFSKARIQRFNELGSEAPPPGTYDPKFNHKVKGLLIEKTERFHGSKSGDSKSVVSTGTECTQSSKNSGSQRAATFATPRCPAKKAFVKPTNTVCSKTKTKSTIQTNSSMKYQPVQQLADLKIECSNKDETIQEHERYIEELKKEILKLELEIEELHRKHTEMEEQHKRDIETMAKLQQEVLDDHDEKHQKEVEMLRTKLLDMSMEKEQESSMRKVIEDELRKKVSELSEKINTLETELAKGIEMKQDTVAVLEARSEELLTKLQELEKERDTQIELLNKEKAQLILHINDLTDTKCHLETKLEKRQNVVLELQAQLSALQCELDELKAEYDKLAEECAQEMNELEINHKVEIEQLNDNFAKEKEDLMKNNEIEKASKLVVEAKVEAIMETNSFLQQELKDVQTLYKDVMHRLVEAHQELEDADQKHAVVLQKYKDEIEALKNLHDEENAKFQQLLDETREEYLRELENLATARDKEMTELQKLTNKKIEEETQRIKERTDKIVENAEAVTRETLAACRAESEERVKKTITECDAKIKLMIREATIAIEEEMHLKTENYKACLKRAEAERAALNDKLAQKDEEIAKLSAILEELKLSAATQESFSQSLQAELDKAESELADKKAELRALKDQIRAEAAEMVARRKRFEIVMAENQASVAALSKRLTQSHAEVERLQHELKRGEDCIQEHRDLLSTMRSNSQMVHEQVNSIIEQLDAKRELVDQLEAGSISEFESIKCIFEAKIDNLQQVAAKEIARLQEEYNKKSAQHTEMKEQLAEMVERLAEAQKMLLTLEEKNDAQIIEISRLEVHNNKLEQQLKNQKKMVEENTELINSQSIEHKLAIEKATSRVEELSAKLEFLEQQNQFVQDKTLKLEREKSKWNSREEMLLKELAQERARRETAEADVKALTANNEHLKKEYEDITEKYAEIVGHQNHKQRIKHVTQLKEKINRLEQELQVKTMQLEHQQRMTEKLKNQQKRSHSKGKENVIGISRSSHTTPTSSPHKSLTPLRNRNE